MFDHMGGVMRAFAKKTTQWKKDLYSAVIVAWQKMSKYYAEVIPTMALLFISAHVLEPFRNLPLFIKWHMGMDTNPEDETF